MPHNRFNNLPNNVFNNQFNNVLYGAAPAFDSVSNTTGVGTVLVNFNHTVGSGNNRKLYVCVSWLDIVGAGVFIDYITYNGVALSPVNSVAAGATSMSEIWSLANPPVGTFAVEIAFADFVNTSVGAISFKNCRSGTEHKNTASSTSNAASVSVASTVSGNFVLDTLTMENLTTTTNATVDSSQAQRWNNLVGNSPSRVRGAGSTEVSGGGSVTMSWALAASKPWGMCAVEVVL